MLVTQNPSFPCRGQSFGQCDSARHKKARASFRAFRFTSDGANGDGGARRGRRRDRDRNRPRLGHRKLDRSNRSIEVRNTVTTCHKRRPRDQKRVLGRSRAASVGRAVTVLASTTATVARLPRSSFRRLQARAIGPSIKVLDDLLVAGSRCRLLILRAPGKLGFLAHERAPKFAP